jgi:predicted DNA-binding transcriptional regulator YafY
MTDPTSRVLQLLSLLQTHRFWPGPELAGRLEVSHRTLRRDIDRLRMLGYPVDATPGLAGGYRLAAGTHMPPLLLDDDEAVAIAVGLRAAAGASVSGIEETSVRAMAKLEQILPDRLRRRVAAVHAHVVPLRWSENPGPMVDAEDLALLAAACRDHEEVRFEYERRDGEASRRLVQPHQLVSAGRRWYLVAWDVRRYDWRTFRVDRLSDARSAGARFAPRRLPTEDAAAFVAQSLRSQPASHHVEVVVHGPPDQLAMTARYVGGAVERIDDERCRVAMSADSASWLALVVAELALRFEVELDGPPEVLAQLSALTERLAPITGATRSGRS